MKFTKIIVAVLILLTILFTFLTVNNYDIDLPEKTTEPEVTEEAVTYLLFENELFTLRYPESWKIISQNEYDLMLSVEDNSETTLYIDTNKSAYPGLSDEEKLSDKVDNLKKIIDAEFKEPTDLTINGKSYKVVDFTTVKHETIYYHKTYFTVEGQYIYEIYYVTDDNGYELHSQEMNDVVLSFEIVE